MEEQKLEKIIKKTEDHENISIAHDEEEILKGVHERKGIYIK